MKITFIIPSIGKNYPEEKYPKGWLMEPLAIAALSALTPDNVEQEFFDDRCDRIPYSSDTDLVAISVETYTAKRAYQIAERYRELNIPVVLGGFHPTLVPEEAAKYADAICIGEAENIWSEIIDDAKNGRLKRQYKGSSSNLKNIKYNRAIYADKAYLKLTLIESSRGCNFECEFCTISAFFKKTYRTRPIPDVINEIKQLGKKEIFFIDDNIGMDTERFRELLKALIPLKISWSGQVSIHIAQDESLLNLMHQSGCMLVLIGFESLNLKTLEMMGKSVNSKFSNHDRYLKLFSKYGIAIYATFVFGYPQDTPGTFAKTFEFVKKYKMFFAAINHLVPFPGTPLYARLKNEKNLLYDAWYLQDGYHFGQVAFLPEQMTPEELTEESFKWRSKMYDWSCIFRRAQNFRANCMPLRKAVIFFYGNLLSGKEVKKRQKITLGLKKEH